MYPDRHLSIFECQSILSIYDCLMKPLHIQFQPFPELHTPNLILRRLVQADAPDVFLLRSNKDLMKYIPKPLAQTVADAEALLALIEQKIQDHVGINWGITRKGNSEYWG
jgi:ribosomal-protein-alanine N-acetyltransferase